MGGTKKLSKFIVDWENVMVQSMNPIYGYRAS